MGNIVRHPDLSKISDKMLETEVKYLFDNLHLLNKKLGMALVDRMNGVEMPVPEWRFLEDIKISVDRLVAVIDEINYRVIP